MITENIKNVKEIISAKCLEVNRKSDEVKLIVVSKNFGIGSIKKAYSSGQNDFAENRPQEFDGKAKLLKDNICWHFIGNLQRNKVKFVVKWAEYIHSVNSIALATEINNKANKLFKNQKIFLEINTSKEITKKGIIDFSEIEGCVNKISEMKNLNLVGLMTMAPYTDDEKIIRNCFRDLRLLKDKLVTKGIQLSHLSMGMSSDYKIAIEEGATMVRIGSAIFGPRDYSRSWKEL